MDGRSEVPREWVFTFGASHRGHAILDGARIEPGEQGAGFRLDSRYVVIYGTEQEARARMVEIFGQVWASQYSTRAGAGVNRYGLTELVIT